MKRIFKSMLMMLLAGGLWGCSTYPGVSHNDSGRSNLDESSRENHNSLLPASFYESNHEIDS